jgi:putative transcriptional regulator
MKYKSEIYEAVHQDATEMFKIGAITDVRMKEYDEMCLVQESETVHENKLENPITMEHVTA